MNQDILDAIEAKNDRKREKGRVITSAHEGYALILEEVDELWDEVKKKIKKQDKSKMRDEAIDIAAVAIRFIEDFCGEK